MGEDGDHPEQWVALAPGVLGRPGAPVSRGAPTRPPQSSEPRQPTTGPIRRRRVLAGVVLLAVVLGGALGLVAMASGQPRGSPEAAMRSDAPRSSWSAGRTGSPSPGATDLASIDWWGVLAELDRRRADALRAGDAAALDGYAVRDSPAWRADAALVASLSEAGLHPVGLGAPVLAIEQVSGCGADACLIVVDRRSAYTIVDAQGETVEEVPAAAASRWRISLASVAAGDAAQPSDPGWRVRQVEAMP